MKIDTKRLDHIIEEVLEEVLSEQSFVRDGDDATLGRINKQIVPPPMKAPEYDKEMYFNSFPGLREKWTKKYNSDPAFKRFADAHDTKVIANNKAYAAEIKSGRGLTLRRPQLTSVQLMGN